MVSQNSEYSIQYNAWGGPESLETGPLHPPGKLRRDHIRVRVRSISVNPVDWKILAGEQIAGVRLMHLLSFRRGPLFPRVFGSDFAGEVTESRSHRFTPGERVAGMLSPLSGGSGSTEICVRASHCISLPDHWSWDQGASLPAAGISALQTCKPFGRVSDSGRSGGPGSAGEQRSPGRVLLIGAAGGVGSISLQILARRGWEVHATGRPGQAELLKDLGARRVVPRDTWPDYIRSEGLWQGIIDAPGALIRGRSKKSPAQLLDPRHPGACYYPVYIPNDFIGSQLLRIMKWRLFGKGKRSAMMLAYPSARRMKELQENINSGIIRPVVDSSWSLKESSPASPVSHAMNGGVSGKVIIRLDG